MCSTFRFVTDMKGKNDSCVQEFMKPIDCSIPLSVSGRPQQEGTAPLLIVDRLQSVLETHAYMF